MKILTRVMSVLIVAGTLVLASLIMARPVEAEPQPAPVEAPMAFTRATNIGSAPISANATYLSYFWWDFQRADLYVSVTMSNVNTTTVILQHSPDGSTWYTSTEIGALTFSASGQAYTTTFPVGQFYRIRATVANTNTITPTIKMILH